MKNKFKNTPQSQLIIIGVVIFIIFIMFAFFMLSSYSFLGGGASQQTIVEHEDNPPQPEPVRIDEIRNIKDQMPYAGQNFSMTFDESEGIYYYYVVPENEDGGLEELNAFLQQNGIPGTIAFPGLEKSSAPVPTPEP